MKLDEAQLRAIAALDPSSQGMFLALVCAISGLTAEIPGSRERLIDFLLGHQTNLSPEERDGSYGVFLGLLVAMQEGLQFPEKPITAP